MSGSYLARRRRGATGSHRAPTKDLRRLTPLGQQQASGGCKVKSIQFMLDARPQPRVISAKDRAGKAG